MNFEKKSYNMTDISETRMLFNQDTQLVIIQDTLTDTFNNLHQMLKKWYN
jgi:hypothetical protein